MTNANITQNAHTFMLYLQFAHRVEHAFQPLNSDIAVSNLCDLQAKVFVPVYKTEG